VSRLNQKIYAHIEAWRNRQIVGAFPYLYLDGVILKRSWAGEVRNISVLVALASAAMVTARFSEEPKAKKRTSRAGKGFCAT